MGGEECNDCVGVTDWRLVCLLEKGKFAKFSTTQKKESKCVFFDDIKRSSLDMFISAEEFPRLKCRAKIILFGGAHTHKRLVTSRVGKVFYFFSARRWSMDVTCAPGCNCFFSRYMEDLVSTRFIHWTWKMFDFPFFHILRPTTMKLKIHCDFDEGKRAALKNQLINIRWNLIKIEACEGKYLFKLCEAIFHPKYLQLLLWDSSDGKSFTAGTENFQLRLNFSTF